MGKLYAVKVGRNIGVYDTWKECENEVKGFKGAKFKKVDSRDEGLEYINSKEPVIVVEIKTEESVDNMTDEEIVAYITSGYAVAFTDGSYKDSEQAYTYGLVMIDNVNLKYDTAYAKRNHELYLVSRNVSGEVFAVIEAIQYSISHNYEKLLICHDYEGIPKWISGEWEAKTKISELLLIIYKKYCDIIKIEFRKIKAHSGNRFNELADSLAEKAYSKSKKTTLKYGKNFVVFNNFSDKQFDELFSNISTDMHEISVEDRSDKDKKCYVLSYDRERLFVTYYNTKRKTLMIQGNQERLFFVLLDNIILNSDENIRTILSEVFKFSVNTSKLNEECTSLIPN
ncbi:ribonuclease H1 domain-containing protein [Mariniplasma anaerobium]|uniref:ribonuclease H n=1 Tax=Mariniplasma anaerobium TaxID=2735436 RepID=A0A7U9TIP4_9MOLU|nr:viroplasmin family protein [Mariniplasma anaerobium]BCR35552.1 hypothetical protein MPAN_004450 [Mariniplasma anaerobium]